VSGRKWCITSVSVQSLYLVHSEERKAKMQRRFSVSLMSRLGSLILPLLLFVLLWGAPGAALVEASAIPTNTQGMSPTGAIAETYHNPLLPQIPGEGGVVESCADPSIIKGQEAGDDYWYVFCTTDPLNSEDRNPEGDFNFRLIPILRSLDLVNWEYVGDVYTERPSLAAPNAGLWAPDVQYINGLYYVYYVITNTADAASPEPDCPYDNSIGVATSPSPAGPWTESPQLVIEPRRAGDGCNFFWTYDPEIFTDDDGTRYIYYGSYYGGLYARELSEDGLTSLPDTSVQVTIGNRYEAPAVVKEGDFYYMFVSATDCCRGPLTGYSVFVGRAPSPTGPFVDREGNSFMQGRVGGNPALSMNGNRWVGPGHNKVFLDFAGQHWNVYHAIDRFDPYFEGAVGFTKRPLMLDPVDWVDGWPTVRGGYWASDDPMPAPAAQPGDTSDYAPMIRPDDQPGVYMDEFSDEFETPELDPEWSWVREPAPESYGLEDGTFRFDTQAADLFVDNNSASVLTRPAPAGEYMVEARVRLDLPPEDCCFNYVQAGLVIRGGEINEPQGAVPLRGDDNYVKLVHVSIWETRQTEFAKEEAPVPEGFPRYGNTVVGPPAEWTYLRIVKRDLGDEELYTPYTSQDGVTWIRGGAWTHRLGEGAQIGLVSMGGDGFTANFDYVRVYNLQVPTAVTLAAIDASGNDGVLPLFLAGVIVAASGTVLVLRRRRAG
jgi:arabinan endo-1,5-alpha-L-arabinosidase